MNLLPGDILIFKPDRSICLLLKYSHKEDKWLMYDPHAKNQIDRYGYYSVHGRAYEKLIP